MSRAWSLRGVSRHMEDRNDTQRSRSPARRGGGSGEVRVATGTTSRGGGGTVFRSHDGSYSYDVATDRLWENSRWRVREVSAPDGVNKWIMECIDALSGGTIIHITVTSIEFPTRRERRRHMMG